MDFKKGADYTRDEIHNLYFGRPLPRPKKGSEGTGNWYTGYVRPKDTNDLIVFMNIGVAGRTGHDFPNEVKYESSENIITWHGKPGSHSKQETFKMIKEKKLTAHFFARWNNEDPFKYLGVGKNYNFKDGHPTKRKNGTPTTCIEVKLTCDDANHILSEDENFSGEITTPFAMEKYLEQFIIDNWHSLDLGKEYDLHEESIDGKRKKYRTDIGEIDIFALSKDKKEYLVIELKKGRATDKVVGQIQSYMGYIKEEIAKDYQEVKGLIIGLEDDLRLKRALSVNPNISFRRYEVKFELFKSTV